MAHGDALACRMVNMLLTAYAIFAILAVGKLPHSSRALGALIAVSTFQIYLPSLSHGGLSICIALSVALLIVRADKSTLILREPIPMLATALILLQLASLIWSPTPWVGVTWILTEVPFIAAYVLTAESIAASNDRTLLARTLGTGASIASLNSVLVIVFRLRHSSALAYYASPLGKFLTGPGASTLFTSQKNNVLDSAKAGGLFVNGNVSSLYCGVTALVAAGCYSITKSRMVGVVAAVSYVAVFMTGSKTGLVLAFAIPAIVALQIRATAENRTLVFRLRAMLITAAIGGAVYYEQSSVQAQGADSLSTRFGIWSAARQIIGQSPLIGNGFGAWEQSFAPYSVSLNLSSSLPPHNLILYTWSQSGILPAILVCTFIFQTVRLLRGKISNGLDLGLSCSALGAVAWVSLHGMADNTSVVGEAHVAVILGASVASALGERGASPTHLSDSNWREKQAGR